MLPLDESESGHLILPLFPDPGDATRPVSGVTPGAAGSAAPERSSIATRQRLDFNTQVRETRSMSPVRFGDRAVRGPYLYGFFT